MVKGKPCVLVLFGVLSLWENDVVSCTLDNTEEKNLLMARGYSGDFSKVRRDIVCSYGSELMLDEINFKGNQKIRETARQTQESMIGSLRKILGSVNYPVGLRTSSGMQSRTWGYLVNVNVANEKSEADKFSGAVEAILIKEKLLPPRAKQKQSVIDKVMQNLDRIIEQGVEELSESSKVELNDGGLISVDTEIFVDMGNVDHIGQIRGGPVLIAEKNAKELLIDVLCRRLVVCLPTSAEIHFWESREARHGELSEDFYGFEESLDNFLLKMRYKIRNNLDLKNPSKELEKWMDGFVDVYRRLPVSRKVVMAPNDLLEKSVTDDSPDGFAFKELGRVILAAQSPTASSRGRKPFIVVYGMEPDRVKTYLTSRLNWPVHEVSAENLKISEEKVALGQSWSWKEIKELEEINKGWILDTLMEEKEGKTFLNSVLLIKNSERLLDGERVAACGGVGKELSKFIKDLVRERCATMYIPYLGADVRTDHLITIMITEREKKDITPGVGTINIEYLNPSLVLNFSTQGSKNHLPELKVDKVGNANFVNKRIPALPAPSSASMKENISEKPVDNAVSSNECRKIVEDFFKDQNKPLTNRRLGILSGFLVGVLSGERTFDPEKFGRSKDEKFAGENHNFLESESFDSVKDLIYDYLLANSNQ